MIKYGKDGAVSTVTDDELEVLADVYLRLLQNPKFKKLSREFQAIVNDYLDDELNAWLRREKVRRTP